MSLEELVKDQAFSYKVRKDNKLFIYYYGKQVRILTRQKARQVIEDLKYADKTETQYILARITGNFKRGNEKEAKQKGKFENM